MKNKIVIIIIVLQLAFTSFLIYKISNKKNNVLGVTHTNPIKKEDIIPESMNDYGFEYELKPNNTIVTDEKEAPNKAIYTINSDGLNERFDYSLEKETGVFRIIILGNSYSFGAYVDTKDNWTEVIEDSLNNDLSCKNIKKFEVINLAGRGYDVKYLVERFFNKGEKYDPDLVVWFLTPNDFIQVNDLILPKVEYHSEILKKQGDEKAYYDAWDIALKELRAEHSESELIGEQINLLGTLRKNYGGKILFATFSEYTKEDYKKEIREFVDNHKNTFFYPDVTNIYQNRDWFYLTDGHPTKDGHKVIAQGIFQYLKNKDLISCQQ